MSSEINSSNNKENTSNSDSENKTNLNEEIRENENTSDDSFNGGESGKSEDEMINDALNDAANADESDESIDAESTADTNNAESSATGETAGSGEYHEKTEDKKIDEELKAAEEIENADETPSSENDLPENPAQLNAELEDNNPYAPDVDQNDSNMKASLSNDSETQVVTDESVVHSENPEGFESESEEYEGVSVATTEISDEFTQKENEYNSESGENVEISDTVPEIPVNTNPEHNADASYETSETTENSESEHNPDEVTGNSENSDDIASNANADESDESIDVESTANTNNAENSATSEIAGSGEFHEKTEDEKIDEELRAAENIENADETPNFENDLPENPDQLNTEPEDKSPYAPDENQNDLNMDGSLPNDSETQIVADESVVSSENPEGFESEENNDVPEAVSEISDESKSEENVNNSETGERAETSNAVYAVSSEAYSENDTDTSNEMSETTNAYNSGGSNGLSNNVSESSEVSDSMDNPNEAIVSPEISDDSDLKNNIDESNIISEISYGSDSSGIINESNDETVTTNTSIESSADVPINTEKDNPDKTDQNFSNVLPESQVDVQNINFEVIQTFSSTDSNNHVEDNSTKSIIFENASYQQGKNDIGAFGTCGPTSIANALNLVTNSSNYSENGVLHDAINNNLCVIDQDPFITGGTSTHDVISLVELEKGPESDIKYELYEFSNILDINTLAERLDDKNTVAIVGVSSSILWDRENNVGQSGLFQQEYSDHWITVESPVYNSNGDLEGFNIIDSGGGVNYVTADKFETMYIGNDKNHIADPTVIIVTSNVDPNNSSYKDSYNSTQGINYKSNISESTNTSPPVDTNNTNFEDGLSELDKRGWEEFKEKTADVLDAKCQKEAFTNLIERDFEKFTSHFDTSTPTDKAVFWSKNYEKAQEFAASIEGKTLDMTELGQVINNWGWIEDKFPKWEDRQPFWESASTQFANSVNGDVYYYNETGNPGMIWEKTELRILKDRISNGENINIIYVP